MKKWRGRTGRENERGKEVGVSRERVKGVWRCSIGWKKTQGVQ